MLILNEPALQKYIKLCRAWACPRRLPIAVGALQAVLCEMPQCVCACMQEGIELSKAMDEPLDTPTRAAVGAGPTDEQILGSVPAQQVWHKVREHALAGGSLR